MTCTVRALSCFDFWDLYVLFAGKKSFVSSRNGSIRSRIAQHSCCMLLLIFYIPVGISSTESWGSGCVQQLNFAQLTPDLFRVCRPRMQFCKQLIWVWRGRWGHWFCRIRDGLDKPLFNLAFASRGMIMKRFYLRVLILKRHRLSVAAQTCSSYLKLMESISQA